MRGCQGFCRNSSGLCGPFPCQYLKKLHTQERAVEEVKLAIKPYYQKKDITKEEYKDILRKAVHKVGPRAGQLLRGWGRMDGETDTCRQMSTGRTEGWWVGLESKESDRISSSPPGPVLLALGGQVGILGSNPHPSPKLCSTVQVGGTLGAAGNDCSCPLPPRSATAKVGRSTR